MTFVEYAQANQKQAEVRLIYKWFPGTTPETPLYEVSAGYQYVPKKGWAVQEGEEGVILFHYRDRPVIEFEYLRQGQIVAKAWLEKTFTVRMGSGKDWEEVR